MKGLALFLLLAVCMASPALAETTVTLTFAGDVTLGSEERLWETESSSVICRREDVKDA